MRHNHRLILQQGRSSASQIVGQQKPSRSLQQLLSRNVQRFLPKKLLLQVEVLLLFCYCMTLILLTTKGSNCSSVGAIVLKRTTIRQQQILQVTTSRLLFFVAVSAFSSSSSSASQSFSSSRRLIDRRERRLSSVSFPFSPERRQHRRTQGRLQKPAFLKISAMSTATTADENSNNLPSPPAPPLIDVDCNLWHVDLKPLLETNKKDADTNASDAAQQCLLPSFELLQQDAVKESNVIAMLSPSSTLAESKKGLQLLLQLQEQQQSLQPASSAVVVVPGTDVRRIRTTVGIHPYHVQDDDVKDVDIATLSDSIKEILLNPDYKPHIAAVGECGLDTTEGFPPLEAQLPLFECQLQLACEFELPVFVHERLAFQECCNLLKQYVHNTDGNDDDTTTTQQPIVPVIVHCFTGTYEQAKIYLERGYYLSLSGYIFKENDDCAADSRRLLREGLIPLDRLMLETDAPYMGFAGGRQMFLDKQSDYISNNLNAKKRKKLQQSLYPNVPSSLPFVLDKVLQEINSGRVERGEELLSREELAQRTSQTANNFFGFELDL